MDSTDRRARIDALCANVFERLVHLREYTASSTSVVPTSVYNATLMAYDATASSSKDSTSASPRHPGSPIWDEEHDGDLSDVYSMEDAENPERKIQKLNRKIKDVDEELHRLRPLLKSPEWKPASSPVPSDMAAIALPEPIAFKPVKFEPVAFEPLQFQRKAKRKLADMLNGNGEDNEVPSMSKFAKTNEPEAFAQRSEDNEVPSMSKVAKTTEPEAFAQRSEELLYSPSHPPYSPSHKYPTQRKSDKHPAAAITDLTEDDEDTPAASKMVTKTTGITKGWEKHFSTSILTPKSLSPSDNLQLSISKRKRSHSAMIDEEEDQQAPTASEKVAKTAKVTSNGQSVYPTPYLTPIEDITVPDFIALTRKSTTSPASKLKQSHPDAIGSTTSPASKLKRSHSDAIDSTEDEQETSVRRKVAKTTADTSSLQFCFEAPENYSRESTPFYEAPKESYLHRLPAELRNRMYRYVGHSTARVDLPALEEPALVQSFSDLKDEMSSIMFMENKFRIPVYTKYRLYYEEDGLPRHPVARARAKQQIKLPPNNSGFEVGTLALKEDHWIHTVDPRFCVVKHLGFRIMESHMQPSGFHRWIFDYFLNVRTVKGKIEVTHTNKHAQDRNMKMNFKPMCDLALQKAKKMVQQEGFVGFDFDQIQELAASFKSVSDAKSKITRRWTRAKLKK